MLVGGVDDDRRGRGATVALLQRCPVSPFALAMALPRPSPLTPQQPLVRPLLHIIDTKPSMTNCLQVPGRARMQCSSHAAVLVSSCRLPTDRVERRRFHSGRLLSHPGVLPRPQPLSETDKSAARSFCRQNILSGFARFLSLASDGMAKMPIFLPRAVVH